MFRAVSAPMLKSEPGTLLDTVAGITTMGMHISSYFSLACTSSRPPTYACSKRGDADSFFSVLLVSGTSAHFE